MALGMIEAAERDGKLKPGGTILEYSSGNTGTALAMLAAARGYKFIAVADHHATQEKLDTMRAYGAEIVFVEGSDTPDQPLLAQRKALARKLSQEIPDVFFADQADNPSNSIAYRALADEIVRQVSDIRILIGSIGTGGSLCGTGRALKEVRPDLEVHAVEPVGSIIFDEPGGPYYQSGTGIPPGVEIAKNIDYSVIDNYSQVSDREAFNTARCVARSIGLLLGGAAGGVLFRALEYIHAKPQIETVVAIMADGGEKYIGTVFNDEWMREKNLLDTRVETRVRMLSVFQKSHRL